MQLFLADWVYLDDAFQPRAGVLQNAQARAVADALVAARCPLTHDELAARFSGKGAWKKRLPPLLETLVAVGRARDTGAGFVAA